MANLSDKNQDPGSRQQQTKTKTTLAERFGSLGRAYFAFLRMDVCLMAIVNIMALFVNTFIIRAGGSVNHAMVYNMLAFGSQPFFMVLAVLVSRRVSPGFSQRIGFAGYAAFFIFILILGEKAATDFFWIPALLKSFGSGFYYVSYSFEVVEYTTDENRDAAGGIEGTVNAIIALSFPILSGLLLSAFPQGDFTGYRILFAGLLGVVAAAFFFSLRLESLHRTFDSADKKSHLGESLKALLGEKTGRFMLAMTFFKGLRVGAMGFFIEVLIFNAIRNETLVGINSTVGKVFAIIGALLYGIIVTPKRRAKSVAFASGAIILVACILFFKLDWIPLMIFSAFNSGFGIFISEPELTLYFTTIETLDSLKGKAGEIHTANEFFLAAGEVLGIGMTLLFNLLFPGSNIASTCAIILLTGSQFFCAYFIGAIQKSLSGNAEAAKTEVQAE